MDRPKTEALRVLFGLKDRADASKDKDEHQDRDDDRDCGHGKGCVAGAGADRTKNRVEGKCSYRQGCPFHPLSASFGSSTPSAASRAPSDFSINSIQAPQRRLSTRMNMCLPEIDGWGSSNPASAKASSWVLTRLLGRLSSGAKSVALTDPSSLSPIAAPTSARSLLPSAAFDRFRSRSRAFGSVMGREIGDFGDWIQRNIT